MSIATRWDHVSCQAVDYSQHYKICTHELASTCELPHASFTAFSPASCVYSMASYLAFQGALHTLA